jgi:hypothetical protein
MLYHSFNMNETPLPPNSTPETSLDEAGRQVQEMSDAHQIIIFEKNLQDASQRLIASKEQANSVKATALRLVTAVAIAGIALPVGSEFVANTIDRHIQDEQKQNQQWIDEANQTQQRQDFEKGLNNGKVVIETPVRTVTEIPAPKQIDTNTQLPTLPAPITH